MDQKEDLEEEWIRFKNFIISAANDCCGSSKQGRTGKKKTAWWTEEVKETIKEKKRLWKSYLSTKDRIRYEVYKSQRRRVKEVVTVAN